MRDYTELDPMCRHEFGIIEMPPEPGHGLMRRICVKCQASETEAPNRLVCWDAPSGPVFLQEPS